MPAYLTREQVRAIDRTATEEYGVPGIVLMENAGRGTAELLLALGISGPVAICCGKGNNGGDGFVVARHLDNRGVPVQVLLFARPQDLKGDARIAYQIIERSRLPIEVMADGALGARVRPMLHPCDWVVDALFGTGLTRPLGSPFDQVVDAINGSGRRTLAADIPSGLDCDTGRPLGPTVRAGHTATFVALKRGFAEPESAAWTGAVHVVDIGAPRRLVRD